MSAIPATRRQFREMADGTIRVQIDVDPPYRDRFFALFSQIDMAVALVPLAIGPTHVASPTAKPEKASAVAAAEKPAKGKFPPGLTGLAVKWCLDPRFQHWICDEYAAEYDVDGDPSEAVAKEVLCYVCDVESRAQLNTDATAGALFNTRIREPYSAILKELGVE